MTSAIVTLPSNFKTTLRLYAHWLNNWLIFFIKNDVQTLKWVILKNQDILKWISIKIFISRFLLENEV